MVLALQVVLLKITARKEKYCFIKTADIGSICYVIGYIQWYMLYNNALILLYTSCKESEDVWSHLLILARTSNWGSIKKKKSWILGSDSWLWSDLHFVQTSCLLLVSNAYSSKYLTSRGNNLTRRLTQSQNDSQHTRWYCTSAIYWLLGSINSLRELNSSRHTELSLKK